MPGRTRPAAPARTTQWWPNQLNLAMLAQHSELTNPMPKGFNYAKAFKTLDLDAVVKDLTR